MDYTVGELAQRAGLTGHAATLDRMFPDTRLLHVIRDGRADVGR